MFTLFGLKMLLHFACRTQERRASRWPAPPRIRRAIVRQPVPIRLLPQEHDAAAVAAPPPPAPAAGGAATAVRPGHGAVPAGVRAAQVRPERRRRLRRHGRRLRLPRADILPRPRQPHPRHHLRLPLRHAHRPRPPPRPGQDHGRPLLRAVPGHVVDAARLLPARALPGPRRGRAGELRERGGEPERLRRRPAVRVRAPRPRGDAGEQAAVLRRPPPVPPPRAVGDPEDGQLHRAGDLPQPGVQGGARHDVPQQGRRLLPPLPVSPPPDQRRLGHGHQVLPLLPQERRRAAGRPDQGVRRRRAVPAHPGPDPGVHVAGAPPPWSRRERPRRRRRAAADRAVQGRPDDGAQLVVPRQHPGHVLAVAVGHRRGGERAPAEPRAAPALLPEHPRHEGPRRDVPAELDGQDRHQRLVDVRLRRRRPRRPHAVHHDQAGEPHGAEPAVRQGHVHGALRPRAAVLRVHQERDRQDHRHRQPGASCPIMRGRAMGTQTG